MKNAPKAPAPPDPVATAQAKGQMNRETAITQFGLNAVDQVTPYGNLSYDQTGTWADGTPRFRATQTLSPGEQQALDLSNKAQGLYGMAGVSQLERLQGTLSQPFNPTLPDQVTDISQRFGRYGDPNMGRDRVEGAILERMAPAMQRDRAARETMLRNQGLLPGSEGWRAAMDDLGRQENDARLGAILSGGQEQSRLAGLAAQDAGFTNTARQQSLAEQLQLRAQPLNETAALLTGQMVQQPNFVNTPQSQVAPVEYTGLVGQNYAAQMGRYGQDVAQRNATMGGMFGLGGAALGGWAQGGFPVTGTAVGRMIGMP